MPSGTINGNQLHSMMEEKNGPEMARSSEAPVVRSKSDSRYWLVPGLLKFHDSVNYSARIQSAGRRQWFPLGSANKKAAAMKAAEIYSFIQAEGFDAAQLKFKPKAIPIGQAPTVGRLIEVASHLSTARPQSLDAYSKAFRQIVGEIKGLKREGRSGKPTELKELKARIDQVLLADLSPADVVAWKNARLRAVETDPLQKRRAIVTVNTLIRCAKALFGKKLLPFIEQTILLPRPLRPRRVSPA